MSPEELVLRVHGPPDLGVVLADGWRPASDPCRFFRSMNAFAAACRDRERQGALDAEEMAWLFELEMRLEA